MATVSGTASALLCGRLLDGIQDNTLWDLRAWGTVDGGALQELDTQTPDYASSEKVFGENSASLDIFSEVQFDLENLEEVTEVRLYSQAGVSGIMEQSVTPLEGQREFPAGGKLKVTSYKFTVSG